MTLDDTSQKPTKRPVPQPPEKPHPTKHSPQTPDHPGPEFPHNDLKKYGDIPPKKPWTAEPAPTRTTDDLEPPSEPPVEPPIEPPPDATPPIPKPPVAQMGIGLKIIVGIIVIILLTVFVVIPLDQSINGRPKTAIESCQGIAPGGYVACGYCAQDKYLSSNPKAGQCHFCPSGSYCSGDPCDSIICVAQPTGNQQSAGIPSAGVTTSQSSNKQPLSTGSITGVYKGTGKIYRWINHDKDNPELWGEGRVTSFVAELTQSGDIVSGSILLAAIPANQFYPPSTDKVTGTSTYYGGTKKIVLKEIRPQQGDCTPTIFEFDIIDANTLSGSMREESCTTSSSSEGLGSISYPTFILKRQ